MKTIFTLLILILIISTPHSSFSQIPKVISYQGILTDTTGNTKPDGEYNFTFRLYETNSGGSALWSESKKLFVKKGLFTTNLGDQIPFGNDIKFDKPYWLSIQIESEAELPPRIALTSVGYSFSSIYSDTSDYAKQFKINDGELVRSINGKKDNVILKGSGGTAVTTNGDSIIITASGGGKGSITAIQNTDNAFSISNPAGPTTTINLHSPFIINSKVGIGVNSPTSSLDVSGGDGNNADIGIHGSSNDNYGIYGTSNNSYGLFGESASGNGVYARTYATGAYALLAGNGAGNKNYCGLASGGYSIFANGPSIFSTVGIGAEPGQNSTGTKLNINSGNGIGIHVISNSDYAIKAEGSSYFTGAMGIGVTNPASKLDVNGGSGSGASIGIHGSSNDNYGIYGSSNTSFGVFGESSSIGVRARTYSPTNYAVYSDYSASGTNYCGLSSKDYSIYTDGPELFGGTMYLYSNTTNYISGNLHVTGDIDASGSKNFKIDNPLDPANKYLIHSCIESPDRMNIYNGNVLTDAAGLAVVNLPSYFQALNVDYRYQLTVMGQFAQAIIESKIQNNQFTIKTDKPNVEVSWQVTGIRNDAYAKAHPMVVEQEKAPEDRGKYLAPELYRQPKEKGIHYVKPPEISNTKIDGASR